MNIGAKVNLETKSVFGERDPFLSLLARARSKAGVKPVAIVLENLEQVLDRKDILDELRGILMLVDDEEYQRYGYRCIVVSVPSGIRNYLSENGKRSTIANRLIEISEVSRLSKTQAYELISKGIEKKLRIEISSSISKDRLFKHICWYTDRIAQHIQELCLRICLEARAETDTITHGNFSKALRDWSQSHLMDNYAVIDASLTRTDGNSSAGRRNQVLYALGLVSTEDFSASDIRKIASEVFPKSAGSIHEQTNKHLLALSKRSAPIIKRTPRGDEYTFTSPLYRMCLRMMLTRGEGEIVKKVDLSTGVVPWKRYAIEL